MANYSMYKLFHVSVCLIMRAAHLKQKQWAIWWCKTALVCGPLRSNCLLSIRSSLWSSALMWLENGHLSRQKASNGVLKRTLYSPAGHQGANFSWCCCITSLHQSELCYCYCWDMAKIQLRSTEDRSTDLGKRMSILLGVMVIIKTDLELLCIKKSLF